MASSRIAHYLKVMGRDKLGSNLEAPDIKRELQLWIDQYTNAGAIGNEQRAKPLFVNLALKWSSNLVSRVPTQQSLI